ncbi:hypothetical protein R5R35_001802 [Gryllus longicercus]|uniref:Uncharacterized protein n=1 Tax=Gryllus longicercus TaxID=2509291 RepID=A0AAN9VUE3_9ORTH
MSWEAIPYATDAVRFVQPAWRPGPRAAAPLHSSPASAPKGEGGGHHSHRHRQWPGGARSAAIRFCDMTLKMSV